MISMSTTIYHVHACTQGGGRGQGEDEHTSRVDRVGNLLVKMPKPVGVLKTTKTAAGLNTGDGLLKRVQVIS